MKQNNIGIAVVGAGRIGTLRARLAGKHPSVGYLAISDKDPARAKALAEQAGADRHSGSNEDVIADPRGTAVVRWAPGEGPHRAQPHAAPFRKTGLAGQRDGCSPSGSAPI